MLGKWKPTHSMDCFNILCRASSRERTLTLQTEWRKKAWVITQTLRLLSQNLTIATWCQITRVFERIESYLCITKFPRFEKINLFKRQKWYRNGKPDKILPDCFQNIKTWAYSDLVQLSATLQRVLALCYFWDLEKIYISQKSR